MRKKWFLKYGFDELNRKEIKHTLRHAFWSTQIKSFWFLNKGKKLSLFDEQSYKN